MTAQTGGRSIVAGIVGSGSIAAVHARALKALGIRVVVSSRSRPDAFAARFGCEAVDSLGELLSLSDVVVITTPTDTHPGIVRAALDAGVHVVCEKPLTLTSAAAVELAAHAASSGLVFLPAHVVRFMAPYASAKADVAAGRLGEVVEGRFFRGGSSPVTGTWFEDDARSGGIIMDLMIHDLDQARWMLGEVATVSAVQKPATVDGRVPEFVEAEATLTHVGGAVSVVRVVWGAAGTPFRTTFALHGDRGELSYDSLADATTVSDADGHLPAAVGVEDPYLIQLRELVGAVRGEIVPRVGAEDGVAAVALAEAARHSVASGRVVSPGALR